MRLEKKWDPDGDEAKKFYLDIIIRSNPASLPMLLNTARLQMLPAYHPGEHLHLESTESGDS